MHLVATVLVLAVLEGAAVAADLNGAWRLHLDPDFGGNDDTTSCTFVQDGRKLTIDCAGGLPIIGEVTADKVTFDVKTGRNNELTAVFTGTLDEPGNTIKGTWRLESGSDVRNGKFDATRAARP
jgi:hypothetical protein